MHTGHKGIGGHRQLLPGRNGQQGAVVADPERNALAALRARRGGAVMTDQPKCTHSRCKRQSATERLHFSFTTTRGQFTVYNVDDFVPLRSAALVVGTEWARTVRSRGA